MKAIAINRNPGQPFIHPLSVTLYADSAITPMQRPVFLPDFSEQWIARILPACRISRLGKTIGGKFARRYFDAISLCAHLVPREWISESESGTLHGDIAGMFDNALITGQWLAYQPDADVENHNVSTTAQLAINIGQLTANLNTDEVGFERAIAEASKFATLKTGDIIMPCTLEVEIPVEVGTEIKCTLNGLTALDFKLK